ncbi:phosphatidylserine decarboxylase [Campylobacter pinnipediorum]|uniref:phosphatidylserine decarboxylase n=1 Tax=Campylobacter pinnipediorum TaxID=1965231 RepID=UPI003AAECA94
MMLDKMISNLFGAIFGCKFPKVIQKMINRWYVSYFKIDMSEFWNPDTYESLNKLFTREFIKPRDIDSDKSSFISPCDGTCLSCGSSVANLAFSVKGMGYSVSELLWNAISDDDMQKGYDFLNLYLSPSDYHHYHSPFDIKVKKAIYVPGRLYSVAISKLKKISSLYTKNERVILECEIENIGKIWLVFVGALNVGKMNFVFDSRIKTNAKANDVNVYEYDNLFIKKGDKIGNFELGSTIVIISPKGLIKYNLSELQKVKFTQSIGKISLLGE